MHHHYASDGTLVSPLTPAAARVHVFASSAHTAVFVCRQYTSLVLSSAYCAIGVMYCWARALIQHRARLDRIRTYVD